MKNIKNVWWQKATLLQIRQERNGGRKLLLPMRSEYLLSIFHLSFLPKSKWILSVMNSNRLINFLIGVLSCSADSVKQTWQQIKIKLKNNIQSVCSCFILVSVCGRSAVWNLQMLMLSEANRQNYFLHHQLNACRFPWEWDAYSSWMHHDPTGTYMLHMVCAAVQQCCICYLFPLQIISSRKELVKEWSFL